MREPLEPLAAPLGRVLDRLARKMGEPRPALKYTSLREAAIGALILHERTGNPQHLAAFERFAEAEQLADNDR